MGFAYGGLGRLEDAKASYQRAIDQLRAQGERGIVADLAHALNNYGNVLSQQDREDEALPYYLESLDIRAQVYGGHSESVAAQQLNVGRLLLDMQRAEDALTHLTEAHAMMPDFREEESIYVRVANMSWARAVLLTSDDIDELQEAKIVLQAVVDGFARDADFRESRYMKQASEWLAEAD